MPNTITATEGFYQDQLSRSVSFLTRLKQQLVTVATSVKAEAQATPFHQARTNFANLVLGDPVGYAARCAPVIVSLANLVGTVSIVDGEASTGVTDAALLSQVTSSWNLLAGVDTGA
jgi:hypothetical protein